MVGPDAERQVRVQGFEPPGRCDAASAVAPARCDPVPVEDVGRAVTQLELDGGRARRHHFGLTDLLFGNFHKSSLGGGQTHVPRLNLHLCFAAPVVGPEGQLAARTIGPLVLLV